MAAIKRSKKSTRSNSGVSEHASTDGENKAREKDKLKRLNEKNTATLAYEHMAPMPLVFTTLLCSGVLWVMALRDVLATGRIIGGSLDESMLVFSKSTEFFDDSRGWKSTQGGLSSVKGFTSDANNMGGLFVRKLGGAAVLAICTQKLMPLLFHPLGAQWNMGHFKPLYSIALIGNLASIALYSVYMKDFQAFGAEGMGMIIIALLAVESLVILCYAMNVKEITGKAACFPEGKTEKSVVSRIVAKTVAIVSGFLSIVFFRDLFFPGHIIAAIPRDDIYLEWTGAFLHSPPQGSPEAIEQGLDAPLFIGDKFLSQYLALHMLVLCMYKLGSAFLIRLGSDGSGNIKCRMIWRGQAFGDALILFLVRLFAPSAQTASLDLKWHLVIIAYETFILGLFGWF